MTLEEALHGWNVPQRKAEYGNEQNFAPRGSIDRHAIPHTAMPRF
jgi:hypothetical protein